MPDRCEVLPGDSVVARRGGGLLWVDAPGSPALVAALHACLGVAGPGADRVLAAVASQVMTLATAGHPSPSCSPTPPRAPAPVWRSGPARVSPPSTGCRSPVPRSMGAARSPPGS